MITPEKLQALTSCNRRQLAEILDKSGYPMCAFESAKFVGITNGGDFCYAVTYFDEYGVNEPIKGKVFLTYNHAEDKVTADF